MRGEIITDERGRKSYRMASEFARGGDPEKVRMAAVSQVQTAIANTPEPRRTPYDLQIARRINYWFARVPEHVAIHQAEWEVAQSLKRACALSSINTVAREIGWLWEGLDSVVRHAARHQRSPVELYFDAQLRSVLVYVAENWEPSVIHL